MTKAELVGVFTDGDLRRALDGEINVHTTTMDSVMHRGGITITARHDGRTGRARPGGEQDYRISW